MRIIRERRKKGNSEARLNIWVMREETERGEGGGDGGREKA